MSFKYAQSAQKSVTICITALQVTSADCFANAAVQNPLVIEDDQITSLHAKLVL